MNKYLYKNNTENVGASFRRHLINWVLPDRGIVSMFVNPANLTINRQKNIKHDRTKGGFVVQYWGEDLADIRVSGTTGSFGIEGINILENIYRNEQVVFNTSALNVEANYEKQTESEFINFAVPSLGDAIDLISMFGESDQNIAFGAPKPTLAYYACSVEMFYGGINYRGFFTGFNITESSDNLGWFNYDLNFKATVIRGKRINFMPWHRSPIIDNRSINSFEDYESSLSYPRTIGFEPELKK